MEDNENNKTPGVDALLTVIRDMVGEVHPHWKNLHFLPDTHLERELGLDSMARAELHGRIEQSLGITLPGNAAVLAANAGELMRIIEHPDTRTDSNGAYVMRDRRSGVDRRNARATLEDLLILFSQSPSIDPGEDR